MRFMQDLSELGHRERKKLTTRLAIERAAVQIALRQGYAAATAEVIARRADVSLRTFFNYFPSKDVAIVGAGISLVDEQQAHEILVEAGTHLLKGISRVAAASVAAMNPVSDIMEDRRHLVQREPQLLHVHMTALTEFEAELTRLVANHLRAHPERRQLARVASADEEACLAVSMVGSAVRYSMQQWSGIDTDLALHAQDIERTIDMMAEIHRRD